KPLPSVLPAESIPNTRKSQARSGRSRKRYKSHRKYSLVVMAKHRNGDGFIITAYYTDQIKEGKRVYRRET
ncbi:MAG: hypothetical protein COW89_03245, partial [Nitrospinae bacterium CG22_combo_CG10-13_8_21_14_all_47_10]